MLLRADDKEIVMDMDGVEYTIPYDAMTKAKLVLTDELWEEYQAAHEAVEL